MNFYETDFLAKTAALVKEAFKFKKYKAMPAVLAVFTGILMLPIVISSFALIAVLCVLSFLFAVLSAPVKYLHEITRGEGQVVKHATQFIVYFISWPLVFLLYALMAILLLFILPLYALLSIEMYVWTLGGFKFHLFINRADDIEIEVDGRYHLLPLVYVIVGAMLCIVLPMMHGIIHYIDLYQDYLERAFVDSFFGSIYPAYISIHVLFSWLYSLIGFSRHPKAPKVIDEE